MFDTPHRRFTPLIGEYVRVSPHRSKRLWLGHIEKTPYEILAIPKDDITAESAAERLRSLSDIHYRQQFTSSNG